MMTCFDFERRLQELFDLRQTELPDELLAHVDHCSTCREIAEGFVLLHQAVADWQSELSRVQMSEVILLQHQTWTVKGAVVSSIDSTTTRQLSNSAHRHSSFATWAALLVSAMALLVAMGLTWRVAGNVAFAKRQGHLEPIVATAPNRIIPTVQSVNVGDRQLDVLMHDARDAYVALASQAWQQVSTASLLVPSTDASVPFGSDQQSQEVSDPLSQPLAPLGRELRDAVDSWLQQVFNNQDSST